jgi:hypothetical protein
MLTEIEAGRVLRVMKPEPGRLGILDVRVALGTGWWVLPSVCSGDGDMMEVRGYSTVGVGVLEREGRMEFVFR